MARSDSEEYCQTSGAMGATKMVQDMEDSPTDKTNDTTIHSGHFMVSCVHDREADDDDGSDGSEIISRPPEVDERGFDFQNASHEPKKTYQFGNFTTTTPPIDSSLSTLFECMTLAYR